jgi:DUF1009 family protein
MTRGEYRVGINFNPSADDMVDRIKRTAANFIDLIDEIKSLGAETEEQLVLAGEVARLKALAMTEIESAAMWAVKAATKQEPK